MAIKAEITWRRRTEDGERLDVTAQRVGKQWRFSARARRFDRWEPVAEPPIEDWRELLDALERRVPRRLTKPDEVERVKQMIRDRFPEAEV